MTHHNCSALAFALSFVGLIAASYSSTPAAQDSTDTAARAGSFHHPSHKDHEPRRCQAPPKSVLFSDDFNGPDLNPIWQPSLPTALWRFDADFAFFQGASSFSFESLDGASVIRLHNILNNAERRGWSSAKSFEANAPIVYEARFNTLVQSSSTGIDELLEIWLLDANNPDNYDIVALSTPNFGSSRIFTASTSITNAGLDTAFHFDQNTWYRMVISGSPTKEVRASIYNDARTVELIGVNFGHDLSAYASGFRIGISQSMGQPGRPAPTDVALDSVRLTTPRIGTVIIDGCNSGVRNPVLPSGCAISDLVAECADRADRHGEFVKCVSRLTNDLQDAGTISGRQKGAIQRCAAKADIR
jgi:hypothetical protein